MKTIIAAMLFFVIPSIQAGVNKDMTSAEKSKQKVESNTIASYAIGYQSGANLSKEVPDLDITAFLKGINHGVENKKPEYSEDVLRKELVALQKRLMEEHQQKAAAAATEELTEGKEFLAKNAKEDGVVTLDSGLQYKVIKSGDGKTPGLTDRVKTHYKGTLIDGTEFDSSYKRGEPAVFPVNGVIKGWTEALQKMKEGDKWMLFIPSSLAYGERGAGASIPPNATLIFEIELLSVES